MAKKKGKQKREQRYSSAKKRVDAHESGFGRKSLNVAEDVKFFNLDKAGTRRVDVLPYRVGEGNPFADAGELHYERTYWAHRGVGANQDTYVCPAKTADKRCPICEHLAKLQRDPDADEELIKSLLPKERQLWNVIDVEDRDEGVQLWDISFHLFGKLLDDEIRNVDEDEEFENFFHLEDGSMLKLGVKEKKFAGVAFREVTTIGFKTRKGKGYDEEVLDDVHDLDGILAVLDYDKLKAIFLQIEDDDDDDETERPARRKSKSEPEDEPEDQDEEEEEESKPEPKKKPPKKTKPLAVDDEVECEEFGVCTIVKISKDGTSLTLEDEDGDDHRAIDPADVHRTVGMRTRTAPDDDPPPKKKPKPESEEEDDWDEDEEPKKKGKKKPPKDEDDWDKDEDWD